MPGVTYTRAVTQTGAHDLPTHPAVKDFIMSNGGSSTAGLLVFLLPVLLIAFMVFSQRKRQRETQQLQSGLAVGDEVCTTSGLFGRVVALEDTIVTLEIASGVTVRFDRRAIGRTVSPAGPVSDVTDAPQTPESTE